MYNALFIPGIHGATNAKVMGSIPRECMDW